MKTKLIKLSDTHYVRVDDSEIKEGDWVYQTCSDFNQIQVISKVLSVRYNKKVRTDLYWIKTSHDNEEFRSDNNWCQKITHSTKPLEDKYASTLCIGYQCIPLSEIKNLKIIQ